MPTTKTVKKPKDGTLKIGALKINDQSSKTAKRRQGDSAAANINQPSTDVFTTVERKKISLSPTNPRKRIDGDDLSELAGSIRRVGVLEPPLIRKIPVNAGHKKLMSEKLELSAKLSAALTVFNDDQATENSLAYSRALEKYATAGGNLSRFEKANEDKIRYEMIAGERRWRAAEIAGLEKIPVIIKEVSEDDVLEIQIIENLQRRDVHPLDECSGYERLQSELNWTEEEIGLRVGKNTGYITNRLKLKALIQKAKDLFEKNSLTLSHALEIAKYPIESQEEILGYAFRNFGSGDLTVYPMPKFIEQIQKNFLRQLKKAPFSTKSEELRPDGLACVKCPERTNASPLLFAENFSDKDNCLNPKCWESKIVAHIQIQRRNIAEKDSGQTDDKKIAAATKKVPLITDSWYVSNEAKKLNEKVYERDDYKKLSKQDDCKFAERAVFADGDRVGQSELICRNKNCKKHFKAQQAANPSSKSGEALMIRKEEILDAKVAENTRRRVLERSAKKFDAANTIFTHKNAEAYTAELLTRLWTLQCSYSSHTAQIICELLEFETEKLSTSSWGDDHQEQIGALTADERSRLMFLLLTAHEGEIFESHWSYKSQRIIKDLAADFDVDYRKLDAEERLGVIPMKFKDVHRNYLQEVEAGNEAAKIPRVYSEKWKPED